MRQVVTRIMDLLGASAGLVVCWPIMALIGLLIKLDSPGPVIFRQDRVGKDGKVFKLLKFRTMHADVDPYGHSPSAISDPRVTRIGRFLRKTSLDELPQLVNVLSGEMALVGPRPLLPWQYALWTARQRRRCDVKPGLTGWAQVRGRGALTHEDKIELDLWYVDHASLPLDLKIILQTILTTIKREGIYEVQYSRTDPPTTREGNGDR